MSSKPRPSHSPDPTTSAPSTATSSDVTVDAITSISVKTRCTSIDSDKIACIVCLADLPETDADLAAADFVELIARLVPCDHAMHNSCLKPWVERANSCPICRASFNRVKLSKTLTGDVIDEYEVEDRIQRVDNDQNFVPELDDEDLIGLRGELFDDEGPIPPCLFCNEADNEDVMLLCDGCDGPFHTYCCGLVEVPSGVWYCPLCLDLDREPSPADPTAQRRGRSRAGGSTQRSSRTSETRRARPRRRTQRNESIASRIRRTDNTYGEHGWARVWQDVWSHLNRDLDRVEDEQAAEEAQMREWNRRAEIAQAQGDGYGGFRASAATIVGLKLSRPRELVAVETPDSPEAIAAWTAFDEFKRLEKRDEQSRKRQSSNGPISSPKSTTDTNQEGERKRKRPRTRPSSTFVHPVGPQQQLAVVAGPSTPTASSSEQRTSVFGTWISKLDCAASEKGDNVPTCTTSRILSTSPTTLYARTNVPPSSPPWSRPHSPLTASSPAPANNHQPSYSLSPGSSPPPPPIRHAHRPLSPETSPSTSPTRLNLSIKSKEIIQAIVRVALRPHYHAGKVTSQQYTEINKTVSRHLYNIVGSPAHGFSPSFSEVQEERDRLQRLAEKEVTGALEILRQ